MPTPSFAALWAKHPSQVGDYTPCKGADGKALYENQCAVRMSLALFKSGVSIPSKSLTCCGRHKEPHALRVEELAKWLSGNGEFGKPMQFKDGVTANLTLKGKTGIIFFKHYWARTIKSGAKENIPTGDHIDLWNGDCTLDMPGFVGWFDGLFGNHFTDSERFSKSKTISFWPVA